MTGLTSYHVALIAVSYRIVSYARDELVSAWRGGVDAILDQVNDANRESPTSTQSLRAYRYPCLYCTSSSVHAGVVSSEASDVLGMFFRLHTWSNQIDQIAGQCSLLDRSESIIRNQRGRQAGLVA